MNPDIKAEWVAALRSGDYLQGRGQLHSFILNDDGSKESRFCCLGVLSDLAVKAGACDTVDLGNQIGFGRSRGTGTLPHEVREWAGLDEDMGNPHVQGHALTEWNDGVGCNCASCNEAKRNSRSFSEIADAIEGSDL